MAYQSTTAASTGDVLDKIRLFAIAQGWTENRWRDSPETAFGKELCISHADAGYFNLAHSKTSYAANTTSINDISINASSGFDNTKKTNEQADKSGAARCAFFSYPATTTKNVFLFGNTQYIYVVLELTTNVYTHLCFGAIDKAWSYTGGQFVTATWWDFKSGRHTTKRLSDVGAVSVFMGESYVSGYGFDKPIYGLSLRCDFADSAGINWHNTTAYKGNLGYTINPRPNDGYMDGGYPVYNNYRWRTPYGNLSACLPQTMPALSPLLPIVPAIFKDNTSYLPGQWPDVRYVDLSFIHPKQEITLGSDTWVCFPLIAKHAQNPPTGPYDLNSGTFGIAYKK